MSLALLALVRYGSAMTVNHPQFGLMCEICFKGLTPEECVEDTDGQKWDICKGLCAEQAGIKEKDERSVNDRSNT